MHTGSWFKVGTCPDYLKVEKGGRQGCKFGGVIFNLAYAKALRRFVDAANAERIPTRVEFVPGAAPDITLDVPRSNGSTAIVFDVTFVDDEAIVVMASVPSSLAKKFGRAISLLADAFEWYGMTINWKAGKTEALMVFRGRKALAEKVRLLRPSGDKLFIVRRRRRIRRKTSKLDDLKVNVVTSYKHLGSIITDCNNLVPEARNRERSAMSAYVPLVPILGATALSIRRRVRLAWSLIMSRLFYNTHVWSSFCGKPRNILNMVYMKVWRRIAGEPKFGRTAWTDAQIRSMLQVPSIDTYLRQRRLRYLSRLASVHFDALHALLQQRGRFGDKLPWVAMLTNDLCILKRRFPQKFESLPDPSANLEPYWCIARDFPQEWRMLVQQLDDTADDCTRADLAKHEHVSLPMPPAHACTQCGKAFPSARQLSAHCWSKHRTRCNIRRFVGDISQCPVCGTEFFSRARLVKHLLEKRVRSKTRGHSCRERFLQQPMDELSLDEFSLLESRDAVVAKAARRDGHTNIIASRPCRRHAPSVLKRTLALSEVPPRKRLRTKTCQK